MPFAVTDDGVKLFYEETGEGRPVLFIHEFAGNLRSWEPQVRHFARQYRCITYNARGYPPSDVPEDPSAYSQDHAVTDACAVLDALDIDCAHIVGISMGGFCALHLGLRHPDRTSALVVAACGYGAQPEGRESFREECELIAQAFDREGAAQIAHRYATGPARVQFQNKDPRGWTEFTQQLSEHSSTGAALTIRRVQSERVSLYKITDELMALHVPTLLVTGDEDEGCLEPDLMLKRTIPTAGLLILPRTGHTCNLEEPALFNCAVNDFFRLVEAGRWTERDPRAVSSGTILHQSMTTPPPA
jgi:pimeloyl-ACP methyl ester carboxylesterase